MSNPFNLLNSYKGARLGELHTKHGIIRTPAFMPVGTSANVKAMMPDSVKTTGADVILCNTYHLMLRPGAQLIHDLGGLRKFMNWSGPILTDSGGFQIMSLSKLCKIKNDGAEFQSHIDGSKHFLTPEYSTEIQYLLDSTITMALDVCISYNSSSTDIEKYTALSSQWNRQSREAFKSREGYHQFGIIQGGMSSKLRKRSTEELLSMDFEGYAIGGLAVGESHDQMLSVLDLMGNIMPVEKPRYLMGVGKPIDIIESVRRGVDMFDCVLPTRSGRNGQAFTKDGALNIRNAAFAQDSASLDMSCKCPACMHYTKAYIHHLFKRNEILGAMLLTWHNIQYFQDLMTKIRFYIDNNKDFDFTC